MFNDTVEQGINTRPSTADEFDRLVAPVTQSGCDDEEVDEQFGKFIGVVAVEMDAAGVVLSVTDRLCVSAVACWLVPSDRCSDCGSTQIPAHDHCSFMRHS